MDYRRFTLESFSCVVESTAFRLPSNQYNRRICLAEGTKFWYFIFGDFLHTCCTIGYYLGFDSYIVAQVIAHKQNLLEITGLDEDRRPFEEIPLGEEPDENSEYMDDGDSSYNTDDFTNSEESSEGINEEGWPESIMDWDKDHESYDDDEAGAEDDSLVVGISPDGPNERHPGWVSVIDYSRGDFFMDGWYYMNEDGYHHTEHDNSESSFRTWRLVHCFYNIPAGDPVRLIIEDQCVFTEPVLQFNDGEPFEIDMRDFPSQSHSLAYLYCFIKQYCERQLGVSVVLT